MIFKVILIATVWFLAVLFLLFAWDSEIDYLAGIILAFAIIACAVVWISASYTVGDPRWRARTAAIPDFLRSKIKIATGSIPGREVAVQILLLPVGLAVCMTIIGLIWSFLG